MLESYSAHLSILVVVIAALSLTIYSSLNPPAHVKGLAADFRPSGDHNINSAVAAIVDSDICYDQVINEYNQWVHISFAESGGTPRKQALIIDHTRTSLYTK